MGRRTLTVLAVLALASPSTSSAQDCNCGAVLEKQYPTVLIQNSTGTFEQRVWHYFCSDTFEGQARAGKTWGEATVPIDGVPVPFAGGTQYNDSWAKRTRACQAGSNALSLEQAAQVFFQFVPTDVQLNAQNRWLQCQQGCQGGSAKYTALTATRTGEKLVSFSLRLDPLVPLAYVTSVHSDNLTCPSPFVPNTRIPVTGLPGLCAVRDLQKEALLVVVPSIGAPVSWVYTPAKSEARPDPPKPTLVETTSATIEGSFGCGSGMGCPSGQTLVGVTDGTGCNVLNNGFCASVVVRDQFGKVFGTAAASSACVALPDFACGESSECSGGRVLVGYSDGTGCNVRNGGTCCAVAAAGVELEPDVQTCEWKAAFACGKTSVCGPNQVMVGLKDGTSCNVQNQVKCCSLRPRSR